MTQAAYPPLQVDLLLPEVVVSGSVATLSETRRLVDILNSGEPVIEIKDALLTLRNESQGRVLPLLSVQKSSLLLAMPRETEEQIRLRQFARAGITPSEGALLPVAVLVPPYYVEGSARIPAGSARRGIERESLAPFFVLTDATITRHDGASRSERIVVVAREHIAALALRGEA